MSEIENTNSSSPNAWLGLLMAPIAVLLAILADVVAGFGLLDNNDGMTSIAIVGVAGILAALPRILKSEGIIGTDDSTLSLGMLALSLITAIILDSTGVVNSLTALTFFAVMFFGHLYQISSKYEMASILTFTAIGFHFAMIASSYVANQFPAQYEVDGQILTEQDTMAFVREAVGYTFFTWWTIMALVGVVFSALARGMLNPASENGWFKYMNGKGASKSHMPLFAGLTVWIFAHALSFYTFHTGTSNDKLGLTMLDGVTGYIGWWQPAIVGVVAMMVVGMVAERWFYQSNDRIISICNVPNYNAIRYGINRKRSTTRCMGTSPMAWSNFLRWCGYLSNRKQ